MNQHLRHLSHFRHYPEIISRAVPVDDATLDRHLSGFIRSFVVQPKRHRWTYYCLPGTYQQGIPGYRLYNDLFWERCPHFDYRFRLDLEQREVKGIFYAFRRPAIWLSAGEAFKVGHDSDALFLIKEAELAVYFFHEMQEFLCHRPPPSRPGE